MRNSNIKRKHVHPIKSSGETLSRAVIREGFETLGIQEIAGKKRNSEFGYGAGRRKPTGKVNCARNAPA